MRALRACGRKGMAEADGSAGVGKKEIKGSGTGRAPGEGRRRSRWQRGGGVDEWVGAPARGPAGRPRRREGEAMQTVCANESGVREKQKKKRRKK
jgi:hypothetical protein